MKKILFVDDEPNVLDGLRRLLHPMRHEWQIAFATGGAEALEILAREPFDVIVSDMRMPGMNGVELLTEVMKRHPHMVRIMLSGYADQEDLLRSVGPTHQFLSKPCDTETLKATVTRACALRNLLSNERLHKLITSMDVLPSPMFVYTQILEAIQAPDASARKIGEMVARDIGLTAKILQMVNSAFFGIPRRVSDPIQAVCLLGLDTIQSLVLSIHVFSQFNQAKITPDFVDAIWRHSLAVGKLAKRIAATQSADHHAIDEAFTAGLLHDVGKLALAANLGATYMKILEIAHQQQIPSVKAEAVALGATHAEVGAYLMGLWGLPDTIVEALAFHHSPSESPQRLFSPLAAVHIADSLVSEVQPEDSYSVFSALDMDYLAALGLADSIPTWRELCGKMLSQENTEEISGERKDSVCR
ncbi:MAG TPA: response regulator [Chthonomonadaceae bacterium]|nr:response regulator [Chthonomonadaceae bacterium]